MPAWISARWRWLLAIAASAIVGAAVAGRIYRPFKPPRIFDASALGGQSPDAVDLSLDVAQREQLSGDTLEARQADGSAAAIERQLPNRPPR